MRSKDVPADPVVQKVFRVYNLCKAFEALPRAGGILEQDGLLMEYFFVIESQLQVERDIKSKQMSSEAFAAQVGGKKW